MEQKKKDSKRGLIIELLGSAGAITLLIAFGLNSADALKANSHTYQLLNFFGATSVGVSALKKKAWSAAGLEVTWALIAFIALCRMAWQ